MKLNLVLSITVSIAISIGSHHVMAFDYEYDDDTEYYQNENRYDSSVIDIALEQLGKPYRYGGSGPYSFDCSGLVHYAYSKAGIDIPRNSAAQLNYAAPIPKDNLSPGDLVFFSISRNKVSHVGIYLNNNRFIHSPSPGKRVQIVNMNNPYWQNRFVTAARVPH